jgi:hypothetical protein
LVRTQAGPVLKSGSGQGNLDSQAL